MSENYPWINWELSSENYQWELSSENYEWELSSQNYEWELLSENYHLVYHHAEKLRFIGILVYPKTRFLNVRFKEFWFTKINLTQIWYEEFN